VNKKSIIIVGAGNRGLDAYGRYLSQNTAEVEVVGLVDPDPERIRLGQILFPHLKQDMIFTDWRDLVSRNKLADAVIIATQDTEHAEPAIACARLGYHMLLEKPLAPTEQASRQIVRAAQEAGILFAVGHVLRYAPHFMTLHRIIREGIVGDLVTVQHFEDVAYWHQAHSFVRGHWRHSGSSSPMLLAKSCHDIDFLRFLIGKPCRRVHSFGGLQHFRKESKPAQAGKATRCVHCAYESHCPYSAVKIYLRDRWDQGFRDWPLTVLASPPTETALREAVERGPYGRCVYECDNDVVDHQVVNLEYEGGVTASFTMSAFNEGGRKTVIQGTCGIIRAVEGNIRVLDFLTDRWREIESHNAAAEAGGNHGGGDDGLMRAWIQALTSGSSDSILSGPEETLESHLTVFAAERSRTQNSVEKIRI
jgi:predicted dehydrogenase